MCVGRGRWTPCWHSTPRRYRRTRYIGVLVATLCSGLLLLQEPLNRPMYSGMDGETSKTVARDLGGAEKGGNRDLACGSMGAHRETIHLGVACLGPTGARDAVYLLKSVLFSHQGPLHIHLVVDPGTNHTLHRLFDTWQLHNVVVTYYQYYVTQEAVGLQKVKLALRMAAMLGVGWTGRPPKVIIVDGRMRFLTDLGNLWAQFNHFTARQTIGATFLDAKGEGRGDKPRTFSTNVLLVRPGTLWRTVNDFSKKIARKSYIWRDIERFLQKQRSLFYELPSSWNVDLRPGAGRDATEEPKALFWAEACAERYHPDLYRAKSTVRLITEVNGYLFSSSSSHPTPGGKVPPPQGPNNTEQEECAGLTATLKTPFRTHVNWYGVPLPPALGDEADITLVTQLSPDRLDTLVRLLDHWSGPVSAAVYVTDEEAVGVTGAVRAAFRGRTGCVCHLVYRKHGVYPINYLRNVALGEVRTAYTVHMDVDLIPPVHSYARLRRYLAANRHTTNTAWVVPALGSSSPLTTNFPRSKKEAVQLMEEGVLFGYGTQGWKLGHVTTNFSYWMMAEEPFEVNYNINFEPYIVMATQEFPLFDERFPDRMRDKISHTYEVAAKGYQLVVLANLFLVHVPHTSSRAARRFSRHHAVLEGCSKKLFSRFVEDISRKYNTTHLGL